MILFASEKNVYIQTCSTAPLSMSQSKHVQIFLIQSFCIQESLSLQLHSSQNLVKDSLTMYHTTLDGVSSIYTYIHICIYLSIYLSVYLSMCLSIYQSMKFSINLFNLVLSVCMHVQLQKERKSILSL